MARKPRLVTKMPKSYVDTGARANPSRSGTIRNVRAGKAHAIKSRNAVKQYNWSHGYRRGK